MIIYLWHCLPVAIQKEEIQLKCLPSQHLFTNKRLLRHNYQLPMAKGK